MRKEVILKVKIENLKVIYVLIIVFDGRNQRDFNINLNIVEVLLLNNIYVDFIIEERVSRCFVRIDMLNKIRIEILNYFKLDERVKFCQSFYDLFSWWICG